MVMLDLATVLVVPAREEIEGLLAPHTANYQETPADDGTIPCHLSDAHSYRRDSTESRRGPLRLLSFHLLLF